MSLVKMTVCFATRAIDDRIVAIARVVSNFIARLKERLALNCPRRRTTACAWRHRDGRGVTAQTTLQEWIDQRIADLNSGATPDPKKLHALQHVVVDTATTGVAKKRITEHL